MKSSTCHSPHLSIPVISLKMKSRFLICLRTSFQTTSSRNHLICLILQENNALFKRSNILWTITMMPRKHHWNTFLNILQRKELISSKTWIRYYKSSNRSSSRCSSSRICNSMVTNKCSSNNSSNSNSNSNLVISNLITKWIRCKISSTKCKFKDQTWCSSKTNRITINNSEETKATCEL